MIKKILTLAISSLTICTIFLANPICINAQEANSEYKVEAKEIIKEKKYNLNVQKSGLMARDAAKLTGKFIKELEKGTSLEIEEKLDNNWLKINIDGKEAYVPNDESRVLIYETKTQHVDEETKKRQEIVDYALSFEGGRYVWGGINPNTGVDCSGFTRYVVANILGKDLPHSSRAQASMGVAVSEENMRPGDLVFYAKGSIDHVAIYIGKGKIISALNEKKGIRISPYNYRRPVKFVSMF